MPGGGTHAALRARTAHARRDRTRAVRGRPEVCDKRQCQPHSASPSHRGGMFVLGGSGRTGRRCDRDPELPRRRCRRQCDRLPDDGRRCRPLRLRSAECPGRQGRREEPGQGATRRWATGWKSASVDASTSRASNQQGLQEKTAAPVAPRFCCLRGAATRGPSANWLSRATRTAAPSGAPAAPTPTAGSRCCSSMASRPRRRAHRSRSVRRSPSARRADRCHCRWPRRRRSPRSR